MIDTMIDPVIDPAIDPAIDRETDVIELGDASTQTKGGVEHMIEDRDPLV